MKDGRRRVVANEDSADEAALELGLAALRAQHLAMAELGPLLAIRRGGGASCRVLQVPIDALHRGLCGGKELGLEPRDAAAAGAVDTGLAPDEHDQWLRGLAQATQNGDGGAGLFFGFGLCHLQDDSGGAAKLAPILLMPAWLRRADVHAGTERWRYRIRYSGHTPLPNAVLDETLRRVHGVGLPELTRGETPERFVERVKRMLDGKTEVDVRRQVVLGAFDVRPLVVARELDPARWPAERGPWQHDNVACLLGAAAKVEKAATETDLTALLVHPADELQLASIAAAFAGNDLVIEGPPGSGRSQTVANLIAAALACGKKVLLVGEEPAVLETVRRQLEAAGLGDFCLASAAATTIANAANGGCDLGIKRRFEGLGSVPEAPHDGDPAQQVADAEQVLDDHLSRLDKGRNRLGLTPREVFTAALAYRTDLDLPLSVLHGISLGEAPAAEAAAVDEATVERAEANLRRFVAAFELVSSNGSLAAHPWHGVTRANLNPSEWSALADALTAWQRAAEPVETALAEISERTEIPLPRTPATVTDLLSLQAAVPEDPTALYPELIQSAADPEVAEALRRLGDRLDQVRALEAKCGRFFGAVRVLPDEQLAALDQLLAAAGKFGQPDRPLADRSLGEVAQLGELAGEAAELTAALAPGFSALTARLGATVPFSAAGLRQLEAIITLAEAAPAEALALRDDIPMDRDIGVTLAKAEGEARALQRMRRALSDKFDLDKVPHPRVLATATRELARGGPMRALSGEWRKAERVYQSVARGKRQDQKHKLKDLERLLAYEEHLAAFSRHVGYRQALGPQFRGLATDFSSFHALLEWRALVRARAGAFGNPAAGEVLLTLPEGDISALAELPRAIAPWHQALERLLQIWPQCAEFVADADQTFDSMRPPLGRVNDVLTEIGSGLEILQPDKSTKLSALREGLALLNEYGAVQRAAAQAGLAAKVDLAAVGSVEHAKSCLGNTVALITAINNSTLADPLRAWLAVDNGRIARLCGDLTALESANQAWESAYDAFAELGYVEKDLWLVGMEPISFDGLHERAARAVDAMNTLSEWIDYLRAANTLEAAGLTRLGDLVERGKLSGDQVLTAFRAWLYDALARDLLIERPRLATTRGRDLEALHGELIVNRRRLLELTRGRIAHALDATALAYRAAVGEGAFAEVVQDDVGVAALSGQGVEALLALKPCVMMTPAEVSATLDPGKAAFDLVIIHGGAVMTLAAALGSVARARQLVVFGDSAICGDKTEATGDMADALLPAARAALAHVALSNRYGTDHPRMFALVNERFYGGRIRPTPSPRPKAVGQVLTEGAYERGQNRVEADQVVDAALDHMLTRPGESLGIIAMTGEQARLIEDELLRRAAALPAARAFLKAREAGLQPVRVWPAAVAREGRDTMLVSVTYGRNRNGQLLQSFPELGGSDGWRLINAVALSSRKRLVIYVSLAAEDILIGPDSGFGIRALRDFLSACGAQEAGEDVAAGEPTGLIGLVAAALERQGFAGVPLAGHRDDAPLYGVRHPRQPGAFVMALADAVPSRSSERWRPVTLAAQGWHIHRLYAPDCFKDLEGELGRMVSRIDAIQASEKRRERRSDALGDQVMAFRRAVMAQESGDLDDRAEAPLPMTPEEARRALVALREHVIKPACPATDPAHGLLRDPMLDLLLAEIPRTPEAFRSAISVKQLQETDAAQLETYLDQVLEIVARIAA